MNLAYRWPIIYWNCACLSVDSSAINAGDFYNLIDEDIVTVDDSENKKTQNKMDYSKLASALDKFKGVCTIQLPDINKSRLSFTPDVEHNRIVYGLKGITRITEPVINEIMMNRPFTSLEDFLKRVTKRVVTKDKVINLIKCGAFDNVENKPRSEILKDFIWSVCEPKKKLTMQNANMLIDLHLLPQEYEYISDTYKLTKELRKNRDSNKLWYCGDRLEVPAGKMAEWGQIIKDSGLVAEDLVINGEPRRVISSSSWDNFYTRTVSKLKTYITNNQSELLDKLNTRLFNDEWEKYCRGDVIQWELDSMNFYFSGHPLSKVLPQLPVETCRVDQIVEGMQDGEFFIKGKVIPKMKLFTIAGTVLDKDKVKGLVTIQTPSGVVNLKIYKDLFSKFIATIGDIDINGEKEIEQDSFFEKGTHLLVTGIQRGATFVPKVYKSTGRRSIEKIVLDEEGDFVELEEKQEV